MLIKTTILEKEKVWKERIISFEADSIEHAEELINTMKTKNLPLLKYGESNYLEETRSKIDELRVHETQIFEEI